MNVRISAYALAPLLLLILISDASAQAQRTFVSGLGSDGNPCSRTAPCRTFGQAISQTSAGGEVIVLDSAGYGPVTITQAVSITAPPGVYAGISVFSGDGIDINATGGALGDIIVLRGLTVSNQGSNGSGIVFNTGSKLHVESCVVNGFGNLGNSAGVGFFGPGKLEVKDSIMRANMRGILVEPSSGTAQAMIDGVRLEGNSFGLSVREGAQATVSNSIAAGNHDTGFLAGSSSSGDAQLHLERCVASNNGAEGISALSASTGTVQLNVENCVASGNGNIGILAVSESTGVATVRVSNSTVVGNLVGLSGSPPAVLLSRGNNTVEGNGTDTSGTIGPYTAK